MVSLPAPVDTGLEMDGVPTPSAAVSDIIVVILNKRNWRMFF